MLIAGCSGSAGDFVTQAEADGITVHHADVAREQVSDLCTSLDEHDNLMGGLMAWGFAHEGDPEPLSTDDQALLRAGVDEQCPEYAEGLQGLSDSSGGPTGE